MGHGGRRPGAGRKRGSKNHADSRLIPKIPDGAAGPLTTEQIHEQNKWMVAVGVHGGLPPEKIAVLVGLDIDRLRALFSHELAHGHDIVKFATLQQLARATEDGSVTGAKALLAASSESPAPEDPERKDTRGKTNAVMLELLTGGKR